MLSIIKIHTNVYYRFYVCLQSVLACSGAYSGSTIVFLLSAQNHNDIDRTPHDVPSGNQ